MPKGTLGIWKRREGPWQNIDTWQAGNENRLIYPSSIYSFLHFSFALLPVLFFNLPRLHFHPLCVPCSPEFTGFPEHIVASQQKLAQYFAINNWRGPTWPGTLSLNGLLWERSMLHCKSFIRTCGWNVQGDCQLSLPVLILSWVCVIFVASPPSLSPHLGASPAADNGTTTPEEHHTFRCLQYISENITLQDSVGVITYLWGLRAWCRLVVNRRGTIFVIPVVVLMNHAHGPHHHHQPPPTSVLGKI